MIPSKWTGPSDVRSSSSKPQASHVGLQRTEKPRKRAHDSGGILSTSEAALPGVQKLKSALRQTRRLLAKENLAADVRALAERKLKAQEAELAAAQTARTEKSMAVRYHKIKFFERQKVARKLAQMSKALLSANLSKEEQKELKTTLKSLRVDLNYIMHYPKTRKYISLFPPSVRGAGTDIPVDEVEQAKTDLEREALRKDIRARMKAGELSDKPERELNAPRAGGPGAPTLDDEESDIDMKGFVDPSERALGQMGKEAWVTSKMMASSAAPPALGGDDFFAVDEDHE